MAATPPYPILIVVSVLAYLIGGLPFGYWIVRLSSGKDIRTMGSGNIGATNVHRSVSRKAGMLVLLLDMLKGFISVWLAAKLGAGNPLAVALAAVAVMLGHCYPIFLRFSGGKAVACCVGAFLYIAPLAIAMTAVIFIAAVAFSRYISAGSIVGAIFLPFAVWFSSHPPRPILVASIAAALIVIYRHKANISRIRRGNEHPFSLKGGDPK
ncbi:MAG: glycerol-3-phosphate 1-O-acyltransferase PlsY [Bryobacteraceae bacterium]